MDFEGDSEGADNNIDADLDNMDKLFGNANGGNTTKMPSKKFKEDDDDFFDSQFFKGGKDVKQLEVGG